MNQLAVNAHWRNRKLSLIHSLIPVHSHITALRKMVPENLNISKINLMLNAV